MRLISPPTRTDHRAENWTVTTTAAMNKFVLDKNLKRPGKVAATSVDLSFPAFTADGLPVTVIGPHPDRAAALIEKVSGWPVTAESRIAFDTNPSLTVYLVGRIVP